MDDFSPKKHYYKNRFEIVPPVVERARATATSHRRRIQRAERPSSHVLRRANPERVHLGALCEALRMPVADDVLRRPCVLPVIDIRSSGSRAAGEVSAFALDPSSAVVLQLRISEAGCEAPTSYHCRLQPGLFRRCRAAPTVIARLSVMSCGTGPLVT